MKDEDGSELIAGHTIRYDILALALGSVSNDFGVPGVKEHCLYLDSREQADRFRTRLLNHCLRVSRAMMKDPGANEQVRVAIVGGGATGVELAAELYNAAGALRHYGLEVFDESRMHVTLLEAGPRILPALPDKLAAAATYELGQLGVQVRPAVQVVEARPRQLITRTGEVIEAEAAIVREVFARAANGEAQKAIANDLNGRGIPAPGASWERKNRRADGLWLVSALHSMLGNERYIGRVIWNRSVWKRDPDTGMRQRIERPESEWIVSEGPAIVDRQVWERVRALANPRKLHGGKAGGGPRYLLSGILVCGQCGPGAAAEW